MTQIPLTSNNFSLRSLKLPLFWRRLCLIGVDLLLILFSLWLSFWLRIGSPWSPEFRSCLWLLPSALVFALPIYSLTGQYKTLTRYAGSLSLYQSAVRNGLLVLLVAMVGLMFQLPMPPRSSWLLLWFLLTFLICTARFALRDVLVKFQVVVHQRQVPVAIYGAGAAGAQLAASLRLGGKYKVLFIVDDDPTLWRRSINGIPICSPQFLNQNSKRIDLVLLAIPSLTRQRRRFIVEWLQDSGISVMQVPSLDQIAHGKARIDTLQPIHIEDLLGRESVPPDPRLLGPGIINFSILVTGAGGSIGSELCRQILRLSPSRLILLDNSEPSLYAIERELRTVLSSTCELHAVLGNSANEMLVERCFREYGVHVVFHAAAYKHVPIVEANPLSGLANNVLSTNVICRVALRCNIRTLVLVSTDKAVRPTNVMGASKRLSEMVVQAHAQDTFTNSISLAGNSSTRFAIVRFGNVLGSSGSVVPLFRDQIAAGGPITLTHPQIIRYFMTIPEAAQLVLQAASLAQGGDVFLLDMGKPVLIKSLAEQMIRLSGLSVRSVSNPGGDIEISYTGLRPGEKLYEELLIDEVCEPTLHPLIFRARERALPSYLLWPQIHILESAIAKHDVAAALDVLSQLVPEWKMSDSVCGSTFGP